MKKIIYLLILCLLFIPSVKAIDNGYVIDKYLVDIKVNEDNSLDIEEKITVNFKESRHGIIRKIPVENEIRRVDGTISNKRIKITNITVNKEYKKSTDGDYLSLKIGNANKTVKGEQEYIIKYKYSIGKDPLKEKDELYFNIIGTEWDTSINNVYFRITMPKDFDESLLGFSTGKSGQVGSNKIKYEVKENEIIGSYNGRLNPDEGITVRCELPEGYFVYHFKIDYIYFIPLLFLILSFIIWYIFGRNNLIETVEFYPPEGYNSLEIGYLYKGYATDKAVTSLLIYLANKGYIKIEEIKSTGFLTSKDNYKFIKLKEYDGDNENEKIFMSGFFRKMDSNEVKISDLENKFFISSERIKKNINHKENKNKMFDQKAKKNGLFIGLFIVITLLLIIKNLGFEIIFPMLFVTVGLVVVIFMHSSNSGTDSTSRATKFFILVWGSLFSGIPFVFLILPKLFEQLDLLPFFAECIVCISFMFSLFFNMKKRTKEGAEIYGKIKGFRNYLKTVEKEKLESMVMTNPNYFYDILPFTYVLGISDKWIKKFEGITLQEPDWYNSNGSFTLNHFESFMGSSLSSMSSIMTSVPYTTSSSSSSSFSSGSSSSSSGGGSSGGGHGGGGGSSW